MGRRYRLVQRSGTIGRGGSCSVQIVDAEVSRVHVRYEITGDQVVLHDLDSANGTFVNEVPIESCRLREGDQIQLGATCFRYEIFQEQPDETYRADASGSQNQSRAGTATVASAGSPAIASVNSEMAPDLVEGLYVQHPSTEADSDEQTDHARRIIQISSDLNFMYLASLATSSHVSRNDMLEQVLKLIFEWIAADRTCILLKDEETSTLKIQAFRNREPGGSGRKLQLSQSILNYVRKKRVGILTSNAPDDKRLDGNVSIKAIGIHEAICVPIMGREQIIGLIYVDTIQSLGDAGNVRFNEDNLKLMIAIAHQVGFALENDSYFSALLEKERLAIAGQTVASLSHHIKNILQNVNGGSHLIEEGLRGDDLNMIRAGWQIVNRNQREVSSLVNNMLVLCNDYQPDLEPADLKVVIDEVLQLLKPRLEKFRIACHWEPVNPAEKFSFHRSGIRTALLNLLNSSVIACRDIPGGNIGIQVQRAGVESIRISISDNGLAVPDVSSSSALSSLDLDPGQQIIRVELAVSRKLILGHGGEISVQQPSAGGNRIEITLPTDP